jgi:PAS domain S-box-containing protein
MHSLLLKEGSSEMMALGEALVGGASEGIVIANQGGTIVYANPTARGMFGADQPLVGKAVEDLLPSAQRNHHHSLRSAYLKDPSHRRMGQGRELNALRSDGSIFPVEISLNPLELGDRRFIAAMIIDISERKALENQVHRLNKLLEQQVLDRTRELNRSQLLYRTVARNYPNGTIFVLDNQLRYEFAEGKELFEWNLTSEDLKGSFYLEQLPDGLRPEVEQRLRAVLEGKNSVFEVEHHGASYRLNAVSVQVEADEAPRILVVEQNVTEAKQALSKERQLNELKSRFVSMASHEFRTPLSTISSSAELAKAHAQRHNTERVELHLDKIRGAVEHLVSILDDYLSLERFETRNWSELREALHVPSVVEATANRQRGSLKRDQTLELTLPPSTDQLEWSPEEAIQGIVSNLVSNAIKYSEEGDAIRIVLTAQRDSWQLQVEDEGVGIELKDQQDVFARFFRCDRTSHIPGTGVGLDLVQQYVQLLEGQIQLRSTPGVGTTFTVAWPIAPIPTESHQP